MLHQYLYEFPAESRAHQARWDEVLDDYKRRGKDTSALLRDVAIVEEEMSRIRQAQAKWAARKKAPAAGLRR